MCSQVTPVKQIMEEIRRKHYISSQPITPQLPERKLSDISTPDTPYGAFITPNPSPHLRKEMLKWLNKIPSYKKRNSTVSKA